MYRIILNNVFSMKKTMSIALTISFPLLLKAQEVTDYNSMKETIKQEILQELKQKDSLDKEKEKKSLLSWDKFSFSGYGAVNYYNYGTYDSDSQIRDKIDPERLNLYIGYRFNDWISMRSEVEFEHGGTGATMEYDVQEEAGEFEQEIEAGGEVKLEQMYLDFHLRPYLGVRVGRVKLHLNLAQTLDRPIAYFTTHKPNMENEILPLGWYENGLQLYGTFLKNFKYELSFTNGLDSSGFSSRNFVKGGHQLRFEMANADAWAYSGKIDYLFGKNKHTFIGAGFYYGNSNPNRSKKDITKNGYVTLFTAHLSYDEGPLRFNAALIWGTVQNSDLISAANRRLSSTLGVKRTNVGKEAMGVSSEIGYDILHLFPTLNTQQKLYPFVRYEYYDTMRKTQGNIIRSPKWERKAFTAGLNWFITPQIVAKAHYEWRTLGADFYDMTQITPVYMGRKMKENTFSAGIAFSF